MPTLAIPALYNAYVALAPTAHVQSLKGGGVLQSSDDERQLQALLSTPLKRYEVVEVLKLDKYPMLMSLLRPPTQRSLARSIVTSLLDGGVVVS